ncbi:hypothetical protein ACU5EH_19245 [Aliivibrio salmonicida]|uniref:hypothetical protein n=1 Tax=Aliivibrio salmonicida TaxID=40269 RepID=UPI00406D269D
MAKNPRKVEVLKSSRLREVRSADIGYSIKFGYEFGGEYSESVLNWIKETELDTKIIRQELALFVKYIISSSFASETKATKVRDFRLYVRHLSEHNSAQSIASKDSIESYQRVLHRKYNLEEISKATFEKKRKILKQVMHDCFSVGKLHFDKLFPSLGKRTGKLLGATINGKDNSKSYSREGYKALLKFLVDAAGFYKKLSVQGASIEALNDTQFKHDIGGVTYTIKHKVSHVINTKGYIPNMASMFYSSVFVAITGINQSPAFRLTRSSISESETIDDMIKVSITDKRKKKKNVGKPLLIKKYFKILLDKIVEHSKKIDPDGDILFPFVNADGSVSHIQSSAYSGLLHNTLSPLNLSLGAESLKLDTRKLRHSYGLFFNDLQQRAEVLNNSVAVSDKHYDQGSIEENNTALKKGMSDYQALLQVKIVDESTSKTILNNNENSTKTPSGGVCTNAVSSKEAERHTRKMKKSGLREEGDRIHCTSFLSCITCPNHLFVKSESYVYQLMSLQKILINSRYESEAGGLFGSRKIIENSIKNITYIAEHKLDKILVKKAQNMMRDHGISPLWMYEL